MIKYLDKNSSVVLVPVFSHIEPVCEQELNKLESYGMEVRRVLGYSDISRARSQMATDALESGYTNLMWIDSDICFSAEDVIKLINSNLPVVGGIYQVKGKRRLACKVMRHTTEINFGKSGGLLEVEYLATGFLLVKSYVFNTIRKKFNLPKCKGSIYGLIPFFHSIIKLDIQTYEHIYLSEDFSFCERARQCGFKIIADTTIRLGHIGKIEYYPEGVNNINQGWESFRYKIK